MKSWYQNIKIISLSVMFLESGKMSATIPKTKKLSIKILETVIFSLRISWAEILKKICILVPPTEGLNLTVNPEELAAFCSVSGVFPEPSVSLVIHKGWVTFQRKETIVDLYYQSLNFLDRNFILKNRYEWTIRTSYRTAVNDWPFKAWIRYMKKS